MTDLSDLFGGGPSGSGGVELGQLVTVHKNMPDLGDDYVKVGAEGVTLLQSEYPELFAKVGTVLKNGDLTIPQTITTVNLEAVGGNHRNIVTDGTTYVTSTHSSGRDVWTSTDLVNWTDHGNIVGGDAITGLNSPFAYGGGHFLWFGLGIYTATDPTGPWTENLTSGLGANYLQAALYDGSQWVVVGRGEEIWTATDPTGTWTKVYDGPGGQNFRDVTLHNDRWIAVGSNGICVTTGTADPTGTWTAQSPVGGQLLSVESDGINVAIADAQSVYRATSVDGPFTADTGDDFSFLLHHTDLGWVGIGSSHFGQAGTPESLAENWLHSISVGSLFYDETNKILLLGCDDGDVRYIDLAGYNMATQFYLDPTNPADTGVDFYIKAK